MYMKIFVAVTSARQIRFAARGGDGDETRKDGGGGF
jgi:hypothetical protein